MLRGYDSCIFHGQAERLEMHKNLNFVKKLNFRIASRENRLKDHAAVRKRKTLFTRGTDGFNIPLGLGLIFIAISNLIIPSERRESS